MGCLILIAWGEKNIHLQHPCCAGCKYRGTTLLFELPASLCIITEKRISNLSEMFCRPPG